ncbi:MAG: TetR/AcrR family transcriptional regulator [Chloroflexi bacterium]|nr:TetR/AcrR family transcriptional regulator [Chloroflexota bacterium]
MLTRAEATVSSILAAAEDLFVLKPYADVSMRDIAETAQVTTGALYHHFPGKEKLYLEMIRAGLAKKQQMMVEATPPDGSCRERLRCLTRVFLALPRMRRDLMRLVRRDINAFRGRTRESIIRAYQESLPNLVEPILREGIKRGEVKKGDPRWLAWVYIAIVETSLAAYAEQKLGDVDARLEAVLDQFFYGAGKQP